MRIKSIYTSGWVFFNTCHRKWQQHQCFFGFLQKKWYSPHHRLLFQQLFECPSFLFVEIKFTQNQTLKVLCENMYQKRKTT